MYYLLNIVGTRVALNTFEEEKNLCLGGSHVRHKNKVAHVYLNMSLKKPWR